MFWKKFRKGVKRNAVWLVLFTILIVPDLRHPVQIWFNKGFSHINWVALKEDPEYVDLEQLLLVDESGVKIQGSELKGKVVFINSWATWCAPCVAEMPSIQALYQDYQGKVEFVLVSNESFDKTSQFLNREGYTFNSYKVLQLPANLAASTIPTTFILDMNGHLVLKKTGSVNWNSEKIRSILDDLHKEII